MRPHVGRDPDEIKDGVLQPSRSGQAMHVQGPGGRSLPGVPGSREEAR